MWPQGGWRRGGRGQGSCKPREPQAGHDGAWRGVPGGVDSKTRLLVLGGRGSEGLRTGWHHTHTRVWGYLVVLCNLAGLSHIRNGDPGGSEVPRRRGALWLGFLDAS